MGNTEKKMYILKFNFAGSGDVVWRKATFDGKVSDNQTGELYKIVSDKEGNEQYEILDKDAMKNKYGKMLRPFIWVKEKEKTSKKGYQKITIEYTLPGSLGKLFSYVFPGLADSGSFSIANTKKVAIPVIKSAIETLLAQEDTEGIYLRLKGHSRGGVAANLISVELEEIFKNEPRVKICTVTFDPVPGPSIVATRDEDIAEQYNEIELSYSGNNAVVYSVNCGYSVLFSPQVVKNAKVIVITTEAHDAGLYKVSQAQEPDGTTKYSKKGYEYKGKIYNPGNLHKLEKGVYFVESESDNAFNLTKINSSNYQKIKNFIHEKGDYGRRTFLENIVSEAGKQNTPS